jgi:hypothetical protein
VQSVSLRRDRRWWARPELKIMRALELIAEHLCQLSLDAGM